MAWLLLFVAGLIEIAMALALKVSRGWTRLGPSVLAVGLALASIFLLARAARELPAGSAYAIWTGIGTVGVAIAGIVAFHESAAPLRLACIGLIVAGTIGLRVLGA